MIRYAAHQRGVGRWMSSMNFLHCHTSHAILGSWTYFYYPSYYHAILLIALVAVR